jgi:Secretion system C-terminal sorting domain
LKVYPNPANSTINVNHSVAAAGSYMQVINVNGAVVLSKSVALNAFLTAIDISRLAAGPYVIVYWNGKEKKAIVFDKILSN